MRSGSVMAVVALALLVGCTTGATSEDDGAGRDRGGSSGTSGVAGNNNGSSGGANSASNGGSGAATNGSTSGSSGGSTSDDSGSNGGSTSVVDSSGASTGSGGTSGETSGSTSGDPGSTSGAASTSSGGTSSGAVSTSSSSSSSSGGVAILAADPSSVDFGQLPQNGTATRNIRLRNISGQMVRLGTVTTTTSPADGATISPSIDGTVLGADGEIYFDVTWTQLGSDQFGSVSIPVQDANGYHLDIPLYGTQELPPPNCTCPSALTPNPLDTITLTATCSDPNEEITGYRWLVESRPAGSTSEPTPNNELTTDFFVDLAGDYVFRFQALQARGDALTSCTVAAHAVPPQDLHIQLVWDVDTSDVDMHLLGPSGGNWFSSPADCYFSNRNPEWSVAGNANDNPSLDIDDTDGFGPENINVVSPANGSYQIGVHYWCDDGLTTPTVATVRVFCNGTLRREFQRTLSDSRQWWLVGSVDWPSCNITEDTTPTGTFDRGCSL
ncbi:MAG: hypothetical protein AB2A00_25800 [Myxococcota bacterium]